VRHAGELHQAGLKAVNAGRHAYAQRLLEQALARQPENDTLARIRLTLAHVRAELGNTAEGIDLCRLALEQANISAQVRGLVWSQLGMLEARSGSPAKALEAFTEALRRLDRSAEPRATAYNNRGILHVERGAVQAAVSDFESAVAIAQEDELGILRAKARHNLGCARLLTGDLISALRDMDSARGVLTQLSPTMHALCTKDRAAVFIAAGMTEAAAADLRTAAATLGARGLRQRQGEAEYMLAGLLVADDPVEAGRVARQAKRRFDRRDSEIWALRADLMSLTSEIAQGRRRRDQAQRAVEIEQRLSAYGLRHDAIIAALNGVRVLLKSGRHSEAVARARQITAPATSPLNIRLLDREVRAELATARNQPGRAMQHIRRGLSEFHAWQSSFGSLDLQSSVVLHGQQLALAGLSLAVADGRPDVVFEWSERARALASRVAPLQPPSVPEAADDLTMLRSLQARFEESTAQGAPEPHLLDEVSRLRQRIRRRAWYQPGPGEVTEPVALDEARAVLAATGGALVAYVLADGRIYALVVAGNVVEVRRLADADSLRAVLDGLPADLDMAAASLASPMRRVVMDSLGHRLGRLDEALVQPLLPAIGDRPVVVVPTARLAGTPWTLLPGYLGRPLTVPRSTSSWIATRARPEVPRAAGFVAGPRVARADEEVHKSAAQWARSDVLTGPDAVADRVSAMASQVDVLHSATHGRHSADNPLFSGLELADGPWFGYDIAQLDGIPATVVLSACELGRSTIRAGEETIGMTVAWLHAGARCVIASPSLVNDDVACEVLTATHRRLAAGETASDALAAAADETRAGAFEAPSPFICFGAGW
jgi:tetratricopeptide (TPR) repeat protein